MKKIEYFHTELRNKEKKSAFQQRIHLDTGLEKITRMFLIPSVQEKQNVIGQKIFNFLIIENFGTNLQFYFNF